MTNPPKPKTGRPTIYGLTDPETGELRYIGKANDPEARLRGHIREVGRRRTPLYDWMRKLAKNGKAPRLIVLEECDGDWREAERRWISAARADLRRLLNVADGGDEPHCPMEVRRENGRKRVRILLGKEQRPPENVTREAVVIDAYEWLETFLASRNLIARAKNIRNQKRACFAEDPQGYACWANV